MDPLSILGALSSAIAMYQLSADIAKLCISYGSEVRQGSRDMQLFVDEIIQFQNSMWRLQRALSDEETEKAEEDRLKFLRDVIGQESASLKQCQMDLQDLLEKLQKLLDRTGLSRIRTKVSWPLKSDDAKKVIERMQSIRSAITNATSLDTNDIVRGIDTRQRVMEKDMELNQQRENAKEQRKKIEKWLRHPDPSENHNLATSVRNDRIKSGSWLLDSDEAKKFRSTKKSLLWLNGIAGCGKSVLSSVLIDKLKELARKDKAVRLGYWYFNSNDKQRMSFDSMMRALLSQLLPKARADVPQVVTDVFQQRNEGYDAPKQTDLGVMLRKMIVNDASAEFYIIIDAFDEASSDSSEREQFLSTMNSILSNGSSSVHICVTSRPQEDIRTQLNELISIKRIDLEVNANKDIAMHIDDQLKHDRALSKWPKQAKAHVKEALVDRAGGMFRWVECQLQALKACLRPALLDSTINSLPRTLFEQYEKELGNINELEAEDAVRLLQWLAFPQRKLRLEEAVEMLAVTFTTDPPSFSEDLRIFNPRRVLEICGSLVRIDINKDGRNHMGEKAKVETLTTAHSTVLDFLKSKPTQIGSHKDYVFESGPINLQMAETCLVYLLHVVKKERKLRKKQIARYPFARYCAEFWDDQYRQAYAENNGADFTKVNKLVLELLEDQSGALNYVRLCDPDFDEDGVDLEMEDGDLSSPLYYASLHGLTGIVRILIEKGADVNANNPGYFGTALVAAAAKGRLETVDALLSAGADHLKASERKGYPIAMAVENDHLEIVKLLLQQPGSDINCLRMPPEMIEKHKRALSKKKLEGSSSSLSTGNATSSDGSSDSSVSDSSVSDSDDDSGGDSSNRDDSSANSGSGSDAGTDSGSGASSASVVKAGSESKNTGGSDTDSSASGSRAESSGSSSSGTDTEDEALAANEGLVYIAADNFSTRTLKFLLENEADPNIEGGEMHTAFIAACQGGKEEIIDMLLEFSAQVNVYGGSYGSCLQAVCYNSDMLPLLRKLVNMGVDVNRYSTDGQSALYAAAYRGELEYVKFLLEKGHEVEPPKSAPSPDHPAKMSEDLCSPTVGNRLPLVAAAWQGHLEIIESLLAAGADINRQGSRDGCPLCAVCTTQNLHAVRLLLSRSANVKETGCVPYGNCLQAAASVPGADVELVDLLLRNGADASLQGGRFGSALHAISYIGNQKILQLLLDHGADVNIQCGKHQTVLQAAVAGLETDSIEILVKHGASPNTRGGQYGWPLLRACRQDYSPCVKSLLDNGANAKVALDEESEGKGPGNTPLRIANDLDTMELLVKNGADINENTGLLGTPLTFAARRGRLPAIKRLLRLKANLESTDKLRGMTPLLHAADRDDLKMVRYLVEKGADIKSRDHAGRTALTLAICRNSLQLVGTLMESGLKPNNVDLRGVSDVHYAAAAGNVEICGLVLKATSLDIRAVDNAGWSALHWATKSKTSQFQIIQKLLSLRVDKNQKDNRGNKAIDLAKPLKLNGVISLLQADATRAPKMREPIKGREETDVARSDKACDICGSVLGSHYLCKACKVFELCDRCLKDKQVVHDASHDFELVEDVKPSLSNQDPSIPDLVEHPSSPPINGGKASLSPISTTLAPNKEQEPAETPLEVRWLNQRFKTNTLEDPELANMPEPTLEPRSAETSTAGAAANSAYPRVSAQAASSSAADERPLTTRSAPPGAPQQPYRYASQSRALRSPVEPKTQPLKTVPESQVPAALRSGRPDSASYSGSGAATGPAPAPVLSEAESPPKPLRKIPTGLQAGRGSRVQSPPIASGALSPPNQQSSNLALDHSWENRRYSRPDMSLAEVPQPDAPGKFVAFSARNQQQPMADLYHNTRHESIASLGAHTHEVPPQLSGTRHSSIGGQESRLTASQISEQHLPPPPPGQVSWLQRPVANQLPEQQQRTASNEVFELPGEVSPGDNYNMPPMSGPVELPAREPSVKEDDQSKWERTKIDYDSLYDDDYGG